MSDISIRETEEIMIQVFIRIIECMKNTWKSRVIQQLKKNKII